MSTVHHGPQSCRADPSTDPRRLRYTRVAMVLHWTVAVMIAINIVLIWIVELIPEGFVRPAIDTHKSLGITVMGLVLLHLLWRAANPPPALPAAYPSWERRIAKIAACDDVYAHSRAAIIRMAAQLGMEGRSAGADEAVLPVRMAPDRFGVIESRAGDQGSVPQAHRADSRLVVVLPSMVCLYFMLPAR